MFIYSFCMLNKHWFAFNYSAGAVNQFSLFQLVDSCFGANDYTPFYVYFNQ